MLKVNELKDRAKAAMSLLSFCRVCPRNCGVNRLAGETGFCGIGYLPKVASVNAHFGEEPAISGHKGSGTVFFSGCNMRCVFCQNYPISQYRHGREMTLEKLASAFLWIKKMGCHNLNLVTPSHVAPQILSALVLAVEQGFDLPIAYNSSGYDSLTTLDLLAGVVDIYMPDMKYDSNDKAKKYSGAQNYCGVNQQVIFKMYHQVGDLQLDPDGIALKGILIRHLVLPHELSGTQKVLEFIARNISSKTHISLMSQYFPAQRAFDYPELSRRLNRQEYERALAHLDNCGLVNGWIQQEEYAQAQGY